MRTIIYLLFTITILGFTSKKELKKAKKQLEGFQFIPTSETNEFSGFFISTTEVSNLQYNKFFKSIDKNSANFQTAKRDSMKWKEHLAFYKGWIKHYSTNSKFDKYPVVNISHDAALLYCEWLTKTHNNQFPENKMTFSLPTRKEWITAAKAGKNDANYPWGYDLLTNEKGENMANYHYPMNELMSYNKKTKSFEPVTAKIKYPLNRVSENATITAPVYAYWPNKYGLYQMSGNVAEMILEEGVAMGGGWLSGGYDIRTTSEETYEEADPTIGFRVIAKPVNS